MAIYVPTWMINIQGKNEEFSRTLVLNKGAIYKEQRIGYNLTFPVPLMWLNVISSICWRY